MDNCTDCSTQSREKLKKCSKKRKLEEYSADEGYETPARKTCSPKDLSPDHGCYLDYCSPFQASFDGEDTLDTSCESISSIQVQVKSVVVPVQHTVGGKTEAPCLPDPPKPSPEDKGGSESQRRAILHGEWENEKRLYISSVTRHMKEHAGAKQGVLSELQNLMSNVAEQTHGAYGRQWQHPSDKTCRSYKKRFGNTTPRTTLKEWQAMNGLTFKRFEWMQDL